jgi:hypothetical protein
MTIKQAIEQAIERRNWMIEQCERLVYNRK